MSRCFATRLLLFVSALVLSVSASGQSGTGTINGTVTDSSGAKLASASLRLVDDETNTTRLIKVDSSGHYFQPELPIGRYILTAMAPGFGDETKRGIEISVGVQLTIDYSLAVGTLTTSVDVEAGAQAQVNSTSAVQATLVDEQQIRELPLNGRNFEQLILLAPGVQPAPASQSSSFFGRSASYSISGSRPDGQLVLLDGANIEGYYNRGTGASILGTSLGVDAIAEFQTIVGVYGAQFGGNGSVINAVTRSGTNKIHGSLYEFVRNSVFDARNYFDPLSGPPSFRRNQFGGTLGLPIQKDKTFFFINYEGLRQQLGETNITNVPDQNAHNGLLPCAQAPTFVCGANGLANVGVSSNVASLLGVFPLPNNGLIPGSGAGQYLGVANNPANEDYFTGRLDRIISPKDTATARYTSDNGALVDPFSTQSLPGLPEVSIQRNRFLTFEDKHVFSPTFLDTARFHFTRTSQAARQQSKDPFYAPFQFLPGQQYGTILIGSLSPSGLPSSGIGASPLTPLRLTQNKFVFQNDMFLSVHGHQIQMGIDVTRVQTNSYVNYYGAGDYTFPTLLSFLQGAPSLVLAALPGSDSRRNARELDATPYIQDDWKVNSKLALNLGVRYEFVTNPVEVHGKNSNIIDLTTATAFTPVPHAFLSNPSLKNIDPRFGFSWTPFGPGTAIRGGFGIYHSVISARSYEGFYNLSSPYNIRSVVNPSFPSPFAGGALGAPSLTAALYYNNQNTPYQMETSFGIQQQLEKNTVLNVSYVGNEGRHLFVSRDINPPVTQICPCADAANPAAAQLPAGTRYFPTPVRGYIRLNRNFSSLNYNPSSGTSHYHSLQTSLVHQLSHGLSLQAAYTWSKAMDFGSVTFGNEEVNGSNLVEDPYNVKGDYGPSAFDIRHVGNINLLYTLPSHSDSQWTSGWQGTLLTQLHTGSPYNAILGFDRANVNNNIDNVRPNLVGNPDRPGPVAANPGCAAPSVIHTAASYYNPCAFQLEPAGTFGNARRDQLRAAGSETVDFALSKRTAFSRVSDQFALNLRAEVFNALNHTNLGFPNFTVITNANGLINSAAGQVIRTNTTSRQLQFSLKASF